MSEICPTITAYSVEEYRTQLHSVVAFAKRIHIDLMDGDFAPTLSPSVNESRWPKSMLADLHIMYRRPMNVLQDVIAHHPNLVIVHEEAENVASFVHELHEERIRVGIALLHDTPVAKLNQYINVIDHVLVFSGKLGHHGGVADLGLLEKVREIRALRPDIEIGWDGGINAENIRALADGGVDVLNTGGAIHGSSDPVNAYNNLLQLLQS